LSFDQYFQAMKDAAAVRILVAEDDLRVRDALTELIAYEPDLHLVGAVGDASAAADAAARELPDVAIVDVRMPGGGGAWATREIRRRSPSTRVLAFSGHSDQETVDEMLDAGAHGYLVKGSSITVILETIAVAAAA
jgi:DNA-binding NarL/FixJ family response regulator